MAEIQYLNWQSELMRGIVTIVTVIVGALVPSFIRIVELYFHDDNAKQKQKEERLEKLFASVFELDGWLKSFRFNKLFGVPFSGNSNPLSCIYTLINLYFPTMKKLLFELSQATSSSVITSHDIRIELNKCKADNRNLSEEQSERDNEQYKNYLLARGRFLEAISEASSKNS